MVIETMEGKVYTNVMDFINKELDSATRVSLKDALSAYKVMYPNKKLVVDVNKHVHLYTLLNKSTNKVTNHKTLKELTIITGISISMLQKHLSVYGKIENEECLINRVIKT